MGVVGTWEFIFTSVPGDYEAALVWASIWKLLVLTTGLIRFSLYLMGHHEFKNCVVSIS